ncbi:hypothetical protein PAPHI01_0981, partial [Pancytospora philotis]
MRATLLMGHMIGAMGHAAAPAGSEQGILTFYGLSKGVINTVCNALFDKCIQENRKCPKSMQLLNKKYDAAECKWWPREKQTFICLFVLTRPDPIALIDTLMRGQTYAALEALHQLFHKITRPSIKGYFNRKGYNLDKDGALRELLLRNFMEENIARIREYLSTKVKRRTTSSARFYMIHKSFDTIEHLEPFLYLLRRVASHRAGLDVELSEILEAAFAWDAAPMATSAAAPTAGSVPAMIMRRYKICIFITALMKNVLGLRNFRKDHRQACKRVFISVIASKKNDFALQAAYWTMFPGEYPESTV